MLNYSLSARKQIITVSNYSKEILLKNWGNKNRNYIKVVHNFYEPVITDLLVKKSNTKTLLTIGTVVQYKNPLFWIAVCKEVLAEYKGEIEFVWAGDGELLEECRKACAQFSPIKFVGYRKDVEQLYEDCDIYFQPSVLESHGMAVLGAMYFGKPCVVSDRQGLPESVVNNITGNIVGIENTDEAAGAILSLLMNPQRKYDFGKAGKERINKMFSMKIWEENMNSIFNPN